MQVKPTRFYHGSVNGDLDELKPQNKSFRKKDEGELLFAGADIACATLFLVRMYDHESSKGYNDGVYFFVISDKKRFMELDKGGTVYVLPDANFTCDHNQWEQEWATKENVKPLNKIHFDSALRAMIDNGVKVYFTDKETFEKEIMRKQRTWEYLEKNLGLVAEK
ncbi:MAG: hypothetical protein WDK96_02615 [Candidatus Paceibacterota bacterium]|jgi:hypothetical protein